MQTLVLNTKKMELTDCRILSTIGCGGYANVYLMEDVKTRQMFAVKRQMFAGVSIATWEHEYKTLQRLGRHRNIIEMKDAAIFVSERSWIVLEYCSNGDMFSLMEKTRRLPEMVAHSLFKELIEAIRFLHGQGVIHRDIKPENVLFDDNFTLKL
jgi:serine/threonine protein kinase